MRFLIMFVFVMMTACLQSQWRWDFGVNVGACNYLGDIGGKEKTRQDFVGDTKVRSTRWNVGGFARQRWRPKLSWRLAFDYLRVEGDDKLSSNPGRHYRNFNFRNDIYELSYTLEWFFFENNDLGNSYRYRNGFRAYLFAGAGLFWNNPKSLYRGEWVKLTPYANEGYHYRQLQFNIPMGLGFYFTFNKRNRIGFEINLRKTFTDYIDDISGNYPETPPDSEYEQGLVLRTTELDPADNPGAYNSHTWGEKRGDPGHKDAYATMCLSYSRVIKGKASFYRVKNGGFFGKKRKGRKIRARF